MKNTKFKTKTEKGITLIALIITIVVLMILAAVAINSITNDGIIEQTGSTANQYNQSVKEEESYLQDYEDMLTAANGGYNDKNFKVGDEVSITVGSETHNFYVIEDKTALGKVVLLAKECINTTTLKQENPNDVAFSTESYWGSGTSPYDIKEETFPIPESHIAAKAAYNYGAKIGGKGRLMTYTEANKLASSHSTMIYGDSTNGYLYYWLGSAYTQTRVWDVSGYGDGSYVDDWYGDHFKIRPVIEISKSKVTAVTE